MGRKQDRVLLTQVLDELAHLPNLIWIQTDSRLVENKKVRFRQQRVRQPDPLAIAFRQRADELSFRRP